MPVEQDIVRKVWLKGSDPPLGIGNAAAVAEPRYISGLVDNAPLLTADPGELLEPTPSAVTTETTRFTRYVVLGYASSPRTFLACAFFKGTGHIFVDYLANATYYYRYYAKLVKTSDFATFTDASSEATIMNYSRANASTAGWYDEGSISGALTAKVQLNAGEALLLQVRGASWGSGNVSTSIGIKTANFRVSAVVLV
jgi:hypothetical protein